MNYFQYYAAFLDKEIKSLYLQVYWENNVRLKYYINFLI